TTARLAILPRQATGYLWHSHRASALALIARSASEREDNMRKLILAIVALAGVGFIAEAQAEKVRFAYAVQVHQANMMILQDHAKKYNVELEIVPMRRY